MGIHRHPSNFWLLEFPIGLWPPLERSAVYCSPIQASAMHCNGNQYMAAQWKEHAVTPPCLSLSCFNPLNCFKAHVVEFSLWLSQHSLWCTAQSQLALYQPLFDCMGVFHKPVIQEHIHLATFKWLHTDTVRSFESTQFHSKQRQWFKDYCHITGGEFGQINGGK